MMDDKYCRRFLKKLMLHNKHIITKNHKLTQTDFRIIAQIQLYQYSWKYFINFQLITLFLKSDYISLILYLIDIIIFYLLYSTIFIIFSQNCSKSTYSSIFKFNISDHIYLSHFSNCFLKYGKKTFINPIQEFQLIYCPICKLINKSTSTMKSPFFPSQRHQFQLVTASHTLPIRYQNMHRITISVVLLSFSLWYFGYNLVQVSCLPKNILVLAFSNNISNPAILGFIICLITLGCAFGIILSSYLIQKVSLKKFLLLTNVLAIIVGGVIQVPNIYALGVCRLAEGVIAGCYMQIIPVYIAQITPKQIGWMFSHYPQILVVLGVDSAYILQLIFSAGNVGQQPYWRAIFIIPVGVVLLQSVLVVFFIPDSPYIHLRNNKLDEAKNIIQKIYKEEYVNEVIKEKMKEIYQVKVLMMNQDEYIKYKKELSLVNQLKQVNRKNSQVQERLVQGQTQNKELQKNGTKHNNQTLQEDFQYQTTNQLQIQKLHLLRSKYTPMKMRLGFIIAQSLHMTGILAIVTQAGEIQYDFNINIGQITPVTITTVQLAFTLVSIFVIKGMGTYMNIILGLALMSLNHLIHGIIFIFIEWPPAISISFAILVINMILFGSSLGNSVGIAMSELLHPKLIPYASAVSWLGATACIVILPIIMDALHHNGYPAFFIFGGWSLISCLLIFIISKKMNLF